MCFCSCDRPPVSLYARSSVRSFISLVIDANFRIHKTFNAPLEEMHCMGFAVISWHYMGFACISWHYMGFASISWHYMGFATIS